MSIRFCYLLASIVIAQVPFVAIAAAWHYAKALGLL